MVNPLIWRNGSLAVGSASVSHLMAPALHYGLGVFEGIRAYMTPRGPAIFRLQAHMDRMARGAEVLGMPFDPAEMARGCREVLAASGLGDAYLRPLAFYATGGLGLDVERHGTECFATAIPWANHLGEEVASRGVRAQVSEHLRNASRAIPPLKLCGAYVNSILAKRAATAAGFEEAVFVDTDGFVVEATGENLFMVKDGHVVAVEHPDALPGITRATVMELAGAESRPVRLEELLTADEVFLCGTSAEIAPVASLGARSWPSGPVTLGIRKRYLELVRGGDATREGWFDYVKEDARAPR
jgi:branched-chain amino acid aminotransferase